LALHLEAQMKQPFSFVSKDPARASRFDQTLP